VTLQRRLFKEGRGFSVFWNKLRGMLPFLFPAALAFYVLPLMIVDTGSAMLVLLAVLPGICLLASFLYGYLHGFDPYFTLLGAAAFVPTIFLYYNPSACVYLAVYGCVLLAGSWIGSFLSRPKL
jgi:hypothetical protein